MIARIHKAMEKKDQGFTLIELLVVMIIIGILAAIAIPLFISQRAKAEDSAAKADVSTLGKELNTYWVDGTTQPTIGEGTGALENKYVINGVSIGNMSKNVVFGGFTPATGMTATNWCVYVTNPEGDKAKTGYRYSATGGLEQGVCPATS